MDVYNAQRTNDQQLTPCSALSRPTVRDTLLTDGEHDSSGTRDRSARDRRAVIRYSSELLLQGVHDTEVITLEKE